MIKRGDTKVAIYIRVSTEDQAKEGYSLEVQREYLESFANREGSEIFKVYCDDGISTYSTRREALQQLLKDAKDKKFDLVLVHKIDRFSRKLKDLLDGEERNIMRIKREGAYYVYILKCQDGTYYTGYINDLEKRAKRHNDGFASKYTRSRLPVRLVWNCTFATADEWRN